MAESLLPGTDALPRATVEWTIYRRRHLVRYRSLDGKVSYHRQFDAEGDALAQFWDYAEILRRDAQARDPYLRISVRRSQGR
jgi:hypothetical protein